MKSPNTSNASRSFLPADETTIKEIGLHSSSVIHRRFSIIVSTYHGDITSKLVHGAIERLTDHGVPKHAITVYRVPGAWEIPLAAQRVLTDSACDAVICLGCVIRGETSHDQHINATISDSLGKLSLEFKRPIAFGVLTCNTRDQALARSGGDVGNKGVESADAMIAMLQLFDEMQAQ